MVQLAEHPELFAPTARLLESVGFRGVAEEGIQVGSQGLGNVYSVNLMWVAVASTPVWLWRLSSRGAPRGLVSCKKDCKV